MATKFQQTNLLSRT